MKHFPVLEYGAISRVELSPRALRQLQRCDELLVRAGGESIFDWSKLQYISARNYVGVVQVPGVTIEILPKIDSSASASAGTAKDELRQRAQSNLLYMLSLTKNLPLQERDLA